LTAPSPTGGTITFLFTDIEGSTALEQRVGTARYASLRERHRELLRAAFAAHGGAEQGTEGDSFFVVFASAREALAAAIEAQRALAAEPWPDGTSVRVRMGLHSGEATMAGDSLVGLDINRAARIAAVAHGGQIVLSDATRALVSGSLPDGVHLVDLGDHRLRDLAAPERLAQLSAEGLPTEFPPVRSLDTRPNNLPTQLTTFVGRERELREALDLLGRSRLLTMTGPGGTGKTRLSLQVAAAAADEFPDGVWFVALEPVRDPTLVAGTIAHTLGAAESSARPAQDVLVDTLGAKRCLLVLDNFEQVVAAGPVIGDLLRRCPNVSIVVTTRTALRISGEQEYPVPGLPAPPDLSRLSELERLNLPRSVREPDAETLTQYEAVRLFIARAVAVRPGFAVDNANAPAVAQISARLHGMPLAIELAAARVKLLTPDQILTRLEHHLALLTAGSRDLPERQQTLRGAIAWSYDLLDEGARRLVDRLSVFRGGCDLETAEAVCGPASELGMDLFDGLAALVDQSLLRPSDEGAEPRFVMTETIAEFASEMLAARGEQDAVAERHGRAFLELAERAAPNLSGADQREWLDRLERDHDNLRAALDWATAKPEPELAIRLAFALWRFWQQRGYLNEARARFEGLAARRWTLEPRLAARFAEGFGGIAYWQADHETAASRYHEALRLWRQLGDKREMANALYNDAYADMLPYMVGGEPPAQHLGSSEGRAKLEEALAIYRELGDKAGEGNILWGLGSLQYFTRDTQAAKHWYQEALALQRETGQRTMEAWSLHMLALVTFARDHAQPSLGYAQQSLRHFRDGGDVAGITLVLDDLASIAVVQGDGARAARLYGGARHLQQSTGTDLANVAESTTYRPVDVPSPREALPPEEFERYAAEGAAMSLDELVAYALEEAGTDIAVPKEPASP
jgi:predicted ATPase/class 3 adenylate cyclase